MAYANLLQVEQFIDSLYYGGLFGLIILTFILIIIYTLYLHRKTR